MRFEIGLVIYVL